ncbi:2-(1,2-epoxy-1,2-dihydrophenyl)acetyl-CoA isomerase [Croceicoccus estronivorus]|uniref:enoyl-CoA hydratase-related protein n=1 Tax=Croceicoccus estronivorus TaxID=1172626 RepID=UPI000832BA79|nr:enoyl-CoA hydratase-related protein [Croceicoccus estronivorus]OCC24827.1 2-(1,2-epoxy-1,2-dihydrophenyl)acetyl-CoA isomerase [Croceicoccus estronivorus]
MAYRFITVSSDGPVTTLSIARPDKLNALTPNVFAELSDAIEAALKDGARALVLSGEGRAFCSGADLQPDGAGYVGLPDDLGQLIDDHYNPFTRRLMDLPVPLVTAVNGPAVGAGLSLALAGDIVVAARSAYMLLAFVNIGLVPDAGASWLVAASVGRARAMEMALLGEKLPAAEAKAIGLVSRVVDDADVLAEAQAIAAKLAAGPGKAIGLIRNQINTAVESKLDDVLTLERDNQRVLGRSDDFKEAIAAFAEKRKPQFKGR